MQPDTIVLRPVPAPRREVEKLGREMSSARRWILILLPFSVLLTVHVCLRRPVEGVFVALFILQTTMLLLGLRLVNRQSNEVAELEMQYELTSGALRHAWISGGRTRRFWTVIPWSQVKKVVETSDGFSIELANGTIKEVPTAAFSSDEEKRILIERATGQQRGALT